MAKILPIVIVLFLGYLALKYYKKLAPEKRKPFLIKWAVYFTIGLLLLAFVTGKIHWLGAVAAGALGLLRMSASTLIRFLPFIKFLQSKQIFGNPVFRTNYLELRLDLKTGLMSGTVIAGSFEGKTLNKLNEPELDELEALLQQTDKRGYYLLRVFRQRSHASTENVDYPSVDDPSIDEAKLILGLSDEFDKKDLDKAYKRLMQKLHPDRGGNDYLASRVNRARDLLTEHLNKQS